MAIVTSLVVACDRPASPISPIPVQGTERIAWSQRLGGAVGPGSFTFVAYVDDDPAQILSDTVCQVAIRGALDCAAHLPSMSTGPHQLRLGAIREGTSVESQRSDPLTVLVETGLSNAGARGAERAPLIVATEDGIRLGFETLATDLDGPSALAATLDGRVFIAEASGDIRVWQNGHLQPEAVLALADAERNAGRGSVDLTLHPDFARNGRVYIAYTAREFDGRLVNRVMRYRELNNVFAEAVTILEDAVSEAARETPRIRFGSDGKLYLAFPAATRFAAEDLASYQGKILRINDDGSTPADNPGYSPIVAYGYRTPGALDWQPATLQLWLCERDWSNREGLTRVPRFDGAATSAARRLVVGFNHDFDSVLDPAAAAFYSNDAIRGFRGDLFVAAFDGEHIRRVRFSREDPARVIATERLLDHQFGHISDVVVGPDGALYFSTSNRQDNGTSVPGDDRVVRLRSP